MNSSTLAGRPRVARRPFAAAQAGLSLLAATVFAVRAVRTGVGDGLPVGQSALTGVMLAGSATVLSLVAAALAMRSTRLAAIPLALVLPLEILLLDAYVAPPRLITAIPLVGALAIAATPASLPASMPDAGAGGTSRARRVLTVVSFVLLAPIGLMYFTTGLVAPFPDVFLAYALYAALVTAAVFLARRRSWWVLAVPPVAAGLWFLMLWLGETLRGWSG